MSEEPMRDDADDLVPLLEEGEAMEFTEMEALAVQSLLEANGIEAVLSGTAALPNLPFEIRVARRQLEEATALLKSVETDAADETE